MGKRKAKAKKQNLTMREAAALVPDDLPDGAYFAMCHEMAGVEYGDGFADLADEDGES